MKISFLLRIFFVFFILSKYAQGEEVRVLIAERSEIKKEYVLTENELTENLSRRSDFGKAKWSISEIVKKGENHINNTVLKLISPNMPWPPEDYNDGEKFPVGTWDLEFSALDLCKFNEFLYWKATYYLKGPLGRGRFEISVVFYLNGKIASIKDPKKE